MKWHCENCGEGPCSFEMPNARQDEWVTTERCPVFGLSDAEWLDTGEVPPPSKTDAVASDLRVEMEAEVARLFREWEGESYERKMWHDMDRRVLALESRVGMNYSGDSYYNLSYFRDHVEIQLKSIRDELADLKYRVENLNR